MGRVVLSIGSNFGNRCVFLKLAKYYIAEKCVILKQSRVIENKPEGFESKYLFFNQLILVETDLNPFECLKLTQEIEKKIGRKQKTNNKMYLDRVIDIDVISYNYLKIKSKYLVIPHINNMERGFYRCLIIDL